MRILWFSPRLLTVALVCLQPAGTEPSAQMSTQSTRPLLGGLSAGEVTRVIADSMGRPVMPYLHDAKIRQRAIETARKQGLLEQIDKALTPDKPIPILPYGRFREFRRTGNGIACNNTIYGRDLAYERTVELQNGNRTPRFINNLVHGRMYLQDGVEQQSNIVGDLTGWLVNPAIGDLHLDGKAGDAAGKAVPLREVREDIDRQPRNARPTIGAAERQT